MCAAVCVRVFVCVCLREQKSVPLGFGGIFKKDFDASGRKKSEAFCKKMLCKNIQERGAMTVAWWENGGQRARGVNLKQQEEWEAEDKLLALRKGSFLFLAEALSTQMISAGRGGVLPFSVGRTWRRSPGEGT